MQPENVLNILKIFLFNINLSVMLLYLSNQFCSIESEKLLERM